MLGILIIGWVVIACLLVIASGVWVAIKLMEELTQSSRGTGDQKTETSKR